MDKFKDIPSNEIKEWEDFLENEINSNFNYSDIKKDSRDYKEKIRIDLHGYTIDEAYNYLVKIIADIYTKRNITHLSIITGKGSNMGLYREVPLWLETSKFKKYIKSFERNKNNSGELLVIMNL